jgi:hypothetical protein
MGLYAAAWFILPFLAVLAKPRHALLGGAVALVLARLLLQSGIAQLYVASAGVTAGLIFLYGCAHTIHRRAAPIGIMGGLALSMLVHVLLDGVDLVWRDGALPWLAVLSVCTAFLTLLRPAPPATVASEGSEQTRGVDPATVTSAGVEPTRGVDLAPALTWFLLGPMMLLTGVVATGWAKPAEGPLSLWQVLAGTGVLALILISATAQAAVLPISPLIDFAAGVLVVIFTALLTMPVSSAGSSPVSALLILFLAVPAWPCSAEP